MPPVTSVALVGGTGRSGPGLAMRLARAGVAVRIGSRDAERGAEAAAAVTATLAALGGSPASVTGHDNADAVREADLTVITVPYEAQAATLPPLRDLLRDRIVVSTVVPMGWTDGRAELLAVPEGSAAEQAAAILDHSRVCAAFHSLSSAVLKRADRGVDQDVMVTGDDEEARATVRALAELMPGVRGIDAGPLRNARHTEALTVLLLAVNRSHKAHTGVRLTGLPQLSRGD